MKHGKQLLGLVLTLAMVVSLLPAAALAGGTEIFVYNYDELVKALSDVQNIPPDQSRSIIIAAEGKNKNGFTWPAGETSVTIEFPNNIAFSVGDPLFPETLGVWVIPENVTILQKDAVSVNTTIECRGTWEMQQAAGGHRPELWGDHDLMAYGSIVLQGTARCGISLRGNCQAFVRENFGFSGILELEDGIVLQKHPESSWPNLAVLGGTLQCPRQGSARIQMSIDVCSGTKRDENHQLYPVSPKLTGNFVMAEYTPIQFRADTVLTCESGVMDLQQIRLEDNTTLRIAQGAEVKAGVEGTKQDFSPETDQQITRACTNAKVQIDGQLTLRGYQNEFYDVTVGSKGVLNIPADMSLEWWPERCDTGHIYGTGTVHAYEGLVYGYESHGSVKICSNYRETEHGFTYDSIRILEDDPGCAEERARHIDASITLIRDWIWEKPADDMYPVLSEVLDQNGQPVPDALILLKNEAGEPVDKVHYAEGGADRYTLSIAAPEGMRIREVLIGTLNWTSNFYENTEHTADAEYFLKKDKAVIKVTLEPVPDPLPVADGIRLMWKRQELTDDMTLNGKELWVTAEISSLVGGSRLPSSRCIRMQMECSLDGTTWYPLVSSSNSYGFDLGSPGGYDLGDSFSDFVSFDTMTAGYDIRCKALPLANYYTVEGDLYSKVYHINGGAKPENGGVVKPSEIQIDPFVGNIKAITIPLRLDIWNGTCMVAAYDEAGRLLSMGMQAFSEAADGAITVRMDLTGCHHIKVFGLSENTPICAAAEKPVQ